MFDITGQDISLLSDEDLRALIGRLCEAELRRHGLTPLAVTWGGHQNATDGGIDVHVAAETAVLTTSAIPRSNVGYQVKAEDMPRSKILAEMRPDDILRASIQELATHSGSYIIVSSKGSVSDTALRERKRAMKDAVVDLLNPAICISTFMTGTASPHGCAIITASPRGCEKESAGLSPGGVLTRIGLAHRKASQANIWWRTNFVYKALT